MLRRSLALAEMRPTHARPHLGLQNAVLAEMHRRGISRDRLLATLRDMGRELVSDLGGRRGARAWEPSLTWPGRDPAPWPLSGPLPPVHPARPALPGMHTL